MRVHVLVDLGSELGVKDSIDVRRHVRMRSVGVCFSVLTLQTDYAQTLNPAEDHIRQSLPYKQLTECYARVSPLKALRHHRSDAPQHVQTFSGKR